MKYPTLTWLVYASAEDNTVRYLPESEWEWPDDAPQMEAVAQRLSSSELGRVALIGGDPEDEALQAKYPGLDRVYLLLHDIFDGELAHRFRVS